MLPGGYDDNCDADYESGVGASGNNPDAGVLAAKMAEMMSAMPREYVENNEPPCSICRCKGEEVVTSVSSSSFRRDKAIPCTLISLIQDHSLRCSTETCPPNSEEYKCFEVSLGERSRDNEPLSFMLLMKPIQGSMAIFALGAAMRILGDQPTSLHNEHREDFGLHAYISMFEESPIMVQRTAVDAIQMSADRLRCCGNLRLRLEEIGRCCISKNYKYQNLFELNPRNPGAFFCDYDYFPSLWVKSFRKKESSLKYAQKKPKPP